jgi:hypothetical protein
MESGAYRRLLAEPDTNPSRNSNDDAASSLPLEEEENERTARDVL